jgi:glucose/arabinose dehydrogenase
MSRPSHKDHRGLWGVFLVFWLFALSGAAHAQTPRIELQPVLSGLASPVFLTSARDGTGRRFIIEQPGRIRVLQPGAATSTVFLDITGSVLCCGERGLLGLAFHPQFSTNRRFFVNYTRRGDGATVISEYRASADPNVADSAETILLTIPQPFENHNGGMIAFGPDGFLYIGMGDGGSGNDPGNRAQNVEDLLGKMLRIDIDTPQNPFLRYSSPSTNPYFGATPGRDEIFAVGLRNPWRFSFDRATNQLYAADVGQNAREEIDIVVLGGNYGWRVLEGTRCTNLGPASCSAPGFIAPIAEYTNTGFSGRCSITGGYVYRGSQQSVPPGAYIYGDYCSGEILMLKDGVQTVLLDTAFNISSFGEDEAGELYVVDLRGSVQRITNPDAGTPSTTRAFSSPDRGAFRVSTSGRSPSLLTGYARIQADSGSALPSGVAIFGLTQNGVLVSEASVPASPLVQSGRVYAERGALVNTGVAIANPNDGLVTLSFFFTDVNGNDFGHGSTTIPARQQVAAFLNEAPFTAAGGPAVIDGTFTFTASLLVSAVAIRGLTNERGEFLMSTLPVVEPGAGAAESITVPHFADGVGWTTRVVLVNPANEAMGGTLQFLSPSGDLISSSSYDIRPRSASIATIAAPGSTLRVGSVRILPQGGAPSAVAILTFRKNGIIVAEAGLPGRRSGSAFRAYVETSSAMQPGVAIANPTSAAVRVRLELTRLDGTPTGLTASVLLPANGQTALFLKDIPGFGSVQTPFQGLLRITPDSSAIAVTVLRCRTNERGDFLFAEMQAADESIAVTSSELLFPHLADGRGFAMQFVLFAPRVGQPSSGTVYFFDKSGQPLALDLLL